jgi:lysophospholipase L1-like esterase
VISVKNYALDTTYVEGRDYTVDGRTIRLTKNSSIPFLNYSDLYHSNPKAKPNAMQSKIDSNLYVTFSETAFFNDRQLAVTYEHDEPWGGPVPKSAKKLLPKSFQTLEKGRPLKLAVFGDSISVGASASGKCVRAPWLPRWGDLVAAELERKYGSDIDYINPSLGGMIASWGRDTVDGLLSHEKPDLVVIGFGMNDAGKPFTTEEFVANTQAIMDSIRAQNADAEFILLMSFQNNPKWRSLDPMIGYLKALKALEGPGVAVADMWTMHGYLLENKTYWDMTGNHVNHPNDFLVRVYAQTLLATLGVE